MKTARLPTKTVHPPKKPRPRPYETIFKANRKLRFTEFMFKNIPIELVHFVRLSVHFVRLSVHFVRP